MTSLTLIVDGELTGLRRPVGRRSGPIPSRRVTYRDADLCGEPTASAEWWDEDEDRPDVWERPELMRVFSAGMPPEARTILEEIARQPHGYPFDALQRTVGLSRLRVAASLNVVAEVAQAFLGKPPLVWQDYRTRTYRMPREVAAFLVPHHHSARGDRPRRGTVT